MIRNINLIHFSTLSFVLLLLYIVIRVVNVDVDVDVVVPVDKSHQKDIHIVGSWRTIRYYYQPFFCEIGVRCWSSSTHLTPNIILRYIGSSMRINNKRYMIIHHCIILLEWYHGIGTTVTSTCTQHRTALVFVFVI